MYFFLLIYPNSISVLAGIFTYFVLFKMLFADSSDFIRKLKGTAYYFPLALVFDHFFNWSPSFRKMSLRILLWLPSGVVVGVIVYKFFK